jgi:hypothetical protein
MEFIAKFQVSFRNKETKRKNTIHVSASDAKIIEDVIHNNYLKKTDELDKVKDRFTEYIDGFDIIYNGADGSAWFAVYLELSKDANIPDDKELLNLECIDYIKSLLYDHANDPLRFDLKKKLFHVEMIDITITYAKYADFEVLKNRNLHKTPTKKSNATIAKKEKVDKKKKNVLVESGKEDNTENISKVLNEVNNLAETVTKMSVSPPNLNEKPKSLAGQQTQAKESIQTNKKLDKKSSIQEYYKVNVLSVFKKKKAYRTYITLKQFIEKLVHSLRPENVDYQQQVDDMNKFSSILTDAFNSCINWIVDITFIKTPNYDELHLDADKSNILIVEDLFNKNRDIWFHNNKQFEDGTLFSKLVNELSYWIELDDCDDEYFGYESNSSIPVDEEDIDTHLK